MKTGVLLFPAILFSVLTASIVDINIANAGDLSGYVGAQIRSFFNNPGIPEQHNNYLSGVVEPDFYQSWDNDKQNVEVKLFYRKDKYDKQRTHADIRELSWTDVLQNWEIRAGISKVFWGVTETQHLVDIINQTDQVEDVDGEDKLGQPMIKASTERDWGSLDIFILPGFRERTYPGVEGRPRPAIVIDTGRPAVYDFSAGKHHIDYALRYSYSGENIEFGVSLFSGVDREPTDFVPVAFNPLGRPTTVVPVYSLINQLGFDGQAFVGDWTWKLEAAAAEVRSGKKRGTKSFKTVGGFEYTLVGVLDSIMDLGFVVEYHYSDQHIHQTIFDNDLATALRFVFNDAQSTEILAGIVTDANTQSLGSFIEASRRLGESWTLEAELRAFHGTKISRPLFAFRFDDFAQIDLKYYF